MQTKLTLRMEKELIESAKRHSDKTGQSLSKMVADFFQVLQEAEPVEKEELTPKVRQLRGCIKDLSLSEMDYKKYLEEKYR